jgi:hypothetical protein
MSNPCVSVWKRPSTEEDRKPFGHKHRLEKKYHKLLAPDILLSASTIESYHFEEEKLGKIIINVTGIKRAIFQGQLYFQMITMDLSEEWVEYITRTCGVEEEGIARLSISDLERPGIIMSWDPQNIHTSQIDGNHRLVRRWREGIKTMTSALVFSLDTVEYMARPGDEETFFREEIRNG